jgi:hypothetical protein
MLIAESLIRPDSDDWRVSVGGALYTGLPYWAPPPSVYHKRAELQLYCALCGHKITPLVDRIHQVCQVGQPLWQPASTRGFAILDPGL